MNDELKAIILLTLSCLTFAGGFFYLDWWMKRKSKERPKKKEG